MADVQNPDKVTGPPVSREKRYGIWAKAAIKVEGTRFEVHVNEGLPDADELIVRTDKEKAAYLVANCVASDLISEDIAKGE